MDLAPLKNVLDATPIFLMINLAFHGHTEKPESNELSSNYLDLIELKVKRSYKVK